MEESDEDGSNTTRSNEEYPFGHSGGNGIILAQNESEVIHNPFPFDETINKTQDSKRGKHTYHRQGRKRYSRVHVASIVRPSTIP